MKSIRLRALPISRAAVLSKTYREFCPKGLAAKIDRSSYEIPALFKALQRRSGISDEKMYNTFNMGIGMVLCLDGAEEEKALETLRSLNEEPVRLGEVVRGRGVIL